MPDPIALYVGASLAVLDKDPLSELLPPDALLSVAEPGLTNSALVASVHTYRAILDAHPTIAAVHVCCGANGADVDSPMSASYEARKMRRFVRLIMDGRRNLNVFLVSPDFPNFQVSNPAPPCADMWEQLGSPTPAEINGWLVTYFSDVSRYTDHPRVHHLDILGALQRWQGAPHVDYAAPTPEAAMRPGAEGTTQCVHFSDAGHRHRAELIYRRFWDSRL